MNKLVQKAARKMSAGVKTDADFERVVAKIKRCMTRDELLPAFLNERMEIDPVQIFRVLRLTNPIQSAVSK